MTLVEFLTARIDEDELDWLTVQQRDMVQLLHGKPLAPRMLAECEAKRKIIKDATDVPTISMRHVLRLIALPYADHPDYDESWRP